MIIITLVWTVIVCALAAVECYCWWMDSRLLKSILRERRVFHYAPPASSDSDAR